MYTIKCDDYILYDPRLDEEGLIVENPKVKVEVNTVGEGSFTIYSDHPYYNTLKKKKSIFEVSDEVGVIFRGRMTNDTIDFDLGKAVDLEGAMAFFNDTIVRPFTFPDDFLEDADYIEAAESGNVVEFFLNWLISLHNAQVKEFQQFKLGKVTVADPNNYISRADSNYSNTWNILKGKLFDSALGGYLCIRYEDDGNYIDYLSEFELTNTQRIVFGENLLDLVQESDSTETYSAIIPLGAEVEHEDGTKKRLTLEALDDGAVTDDIIKEGDTIYSLSAVDSYGWCCAPVADTTWNDVTEVSNLLKKSVEHLSGTAMLLSSTIEIQAVDLHCTDEEIKSFRIYRNILVDSPTHRVQGESFQLTKLDIDIKNPQNTKITLGGTARTLLDVNNQHTTNAIQRIESAEKDIEENRTTVEEVRNQVVTLSTSMVNTVNEIILSAMKNYVETGNYDSFKESVETTLKIIAGQVDFNFKTTTEEIANVDGDLQSKFNEIYKYIRFVDGSIVLGSSESAITLTIENDMISFKKNGVQFGYWDGDDFHTGNIVVEVDERAQFGNFAYIPRKDGSLSFLKVR